MATGKSPRYIEVAGLRFPGGFYPPAIRDVVNYKCRDDDIFLVTYPKCGTTYMHYIIYLIFHNGDPPQSGSEVMLNTPFPECQGIECLDAITRPTAIKSHLPFHLIPYSPKAKYVALTRNPKDCCISFYHHTKENVAMYDFAEGRFDDYFDIFLDGKVDFGDYFDHVLSWYEHRDDSNVLFLTYEELKAHPAQVVQKVAQFLGRPQLDGALVDKIVANSDFKKMKAITSQLNLTMTPPDPSTLTPAMKHLFACFAKSGQQGGGYDVFRKGVVGDWRKVFSEEQNRRMNEKMEDKFRGTELLKYWKDMGAV